MTDTNRTLATLSALIDRAVESLGDGVGQLQLWKSRIGALGADGHELVRVAVAGTVKSGKTTLANALLGDDLLKRGAGIITSVVTRVRPGDALSAHIKLKGWETVNREATEAALFLGFEAPEGGVDLRRGDERRALEELVDALGDEALGENGSFEKHATLLGAMLQGYARIAPKLVEGESELDYEGEEFGEHRDFAGSDALAAYVDDLLLIVPGLDFEGEFELADCQGYDSPNPRHRERVQEYLMGCHQLVYVVSSRVGLREADVRFLRDLARMGLLESTLVVLNVDITEHSTGAEVEALAGRFAAELRPFGEITPHRVSALKALLKRMEEKGEELGRKEQLLLELWSESDAAPDGFAAFRAVLADVMGREKKQKLAAAERSTAEHAAAALRANVEGVMRLMTAEAGELKEGLENLEEAKRLLTGSLENFKAALNGRVAEIRKRAFGAVNSAFQPASGSVAQDVMAHVRTLKPEPSKLEVSDSKKLFSKLSGVHQSLRDAFAAYKVEVVNAQAVEEIRAIWGAARDELEQAAEDSAAMVVEAMEGYRALAMDLGVQVDELELPEFEADIGKRTIPLFSAVTTPSASSSAERVVGFARQWSVNLATGFAGRLFGKKNEDDKAGFLKSLLMEGANAARDQLSEEASSCLLHYNEQVKYQVIGKNLDAMVEAWVASFSRTLDALVLDIDSITEKVGMGESEKSALAPKLAGIIEELDALDI